MSKKDNKISVLTKIRDSKDILFGKFSDSVTKEKKVEEWKNICEFCKALGLITLDKEYSYVRDVFWSNIKRATLAKIDNDNQTDSAGGKKKIYTPIDDLVMEIIGQKSPNLEGIGVLDTMAEKSAIAETLNSPNTQVAPSSSSQVNTSSSSQVNSSHKKPKRIVTRNSTSHAKHNVELNHKKRKIEFQLEFLALTNYKMKLEILEMERRLNIPHSEFTRELVNENEASP